MNPYRQTDPREGMRQSMLTQQRESCRATLIEWIPKRFIPGSEVAVSGLSGRWIVEVVYNPMGRV